MLSDFFAPTRESNLTPAQPPANESNEPTSSRAPDSARDSRQRARWARSSNRHYKKKMSNRNTYRSISQPQRQSPRDDAARDHDVGTRAPRSTHCAE
uniref:SFRICE_004760 n=1 Tax=Spodoptera frugiperda TaxID=7108 RepID=A0A2H1W5G5_SPOFR